MIIHQTKVDPIVVAMPGQPPRTVRQELTTFKIHDDESMKAFHDEMTKGRDLLVQVNVGDGAYIMVREMVDVELPPNAKPRVVSR